MGGRRIQCTLEQIVNEYRGLNLSRPPRIVGVSSVKRALTLLKKKKFDLVFMVPHLEGMEPFTLGGKIKEIRPDLPIILLSPDTQDTLINSETIRGQGIDRTFIWSENPDMLLAMVKNSLRHLGYQTAKGR